ncbi:SWIM zinc finger family protein [Leucobacter aridicollis]|uniref:SWIM-type domain-containing protein n=1 Tax=Leucobacter aridicollis TaxID=283878 RepID=A0A852QW59_9MICO|nr:SWIM zinc finger family protein [Leucobacter aridicollis]NYD26563.1 hypothetical protein [Leucobacter aridicollis]
MTMQHAPAPPAPRAFGAPTGLGPDGLLLGLAPALTAQGIDRSPSFFSGFATEPLVLARGLLVLADITATRYFQYVPTTMRDPVLTANGDRLRAECFSACNSVYARLDLLGDGFDGGDIAHGTTNVDLGQQSRAVLSGVRRAELLHLDVGSGGAVLATPSAQAAERPVNMPDRWVRAFGNVAELHARMAPLVTLTAQEARAFVSAVPPATASGRTAWLAPTAAGTRIASRPTTGAIAVPGLHRLSAAKRLLPHLRGATVYGAPHAETGAVAVVLELPHARLTLGLTAEAWRGHSGEGALLAALAGDDVVADAEVVSALLAFEPVLDADSLAHAAGITRARADGAIAVLAASGRVGWDLADDAHFHRELPDDPARIERDGPRLAAARALVAAGRVAPGAGAAGSGEPRSWVVRGGEPGDHASDSLVRVGDDGQLVCGCAWGLRHGAGRGPCKHALAVEIVRARASQHTGQRTPTLKEQA